MQNTISLTSVEIKEAHTQHPVLSLIKKRWSARSFSSRKIEQPVLDTILEAASWAASGNNEQPWRYRYAIRPDIAFEKLHDLLLPGNHPWAGNAAALIISSYKTNFQVSGKPNLTAMHDLGMANAHLLLQAVALGLYAHPMAGFDKPRLISEYGFGESEIPVAVIALGYLDDPEKLEEPFRSRELTARSRKPQEEFVFKLN
jgi:nitroreductase